MAHLLSVSGTPSVFISGADALHGTMGAMAPGDILVAISRGGGSDEINDLVVRAKERGVDTVVAVTADASSRLARNADVVVELTMIPGIDPGEVIAMGSTLVTAAWGDALAVVLMRMRGYSWANVLHSHPSGAVGKIDEAPQELPPPRALLEVDMDLVAGVDSSTQSCTVELRRRDDGALVGTASAPTRGPRPGQQTGPARVVGGVPRGVLRCPARRRRRRAAGGRARRRRPVPRSRAPGPGRRALGDRPLWNDTTAGPEAARIAHEYGLERWMQDVGMAPSSALTIMKLAHVATTEPALLERVAHVLVPHDYLTYRLTGKRSPTGPTPPGRATSTSTGASGDPSSWSASSRPRSAGPTCCRPSSGRTPRPGRCARTSRRSSGSGRASWWGRAEGTSTSPPSGSGLAEGDLGVSLGTSGVVLSPRRTSVVDPLGTVDSVCDATGGYLPLACTLNAAKVTDTFARLLDVDHATLERLALAAPVRAQRPTLVAYLDGERTPRRPGATGVLGGITGETTREDVALAAYEGVVAGLVGAARALERAGVDTSGEVVVNGGGARSLAYRQVLADALGRPVVRRAAPEATARGACVQAVAVLEARPWPARPSGGARSRSTPSAAHGPRHDRRRPLRPARHGRGPSAAVRDLTTPSRENACCTSTPPTATRSSGCSRPACSPASPRTRRSCAARPHRRRRPHRAPVGPRGGAGTVFLQAVGPDETALKTHGRQLADLGPDVVVKLPATRDGLAVSRRLTREGVPVLATAVYHASQALVADAAGAGWIAPYVGRMSDLGLDGVGQTADLHAALRASGQGCRVLAASLRDTAQVAALAARGIEDLTLSTALCAALLENPTPSPRRRSSRRTPARRMTRPGRTHDAGQGRRPCPAS